MNNKYKLPLIIYDSECSLCKRFVQSLKVLDTKKYFNFESLYNKDLYESIDLISFEDCKKEVHLILDDQVLKGSEVVEYLVSLIPGVKKISWLIESEASKGAMNLFYKKLNSIRQKKKQGCRTC